MTRRSRGPTASRRAAGRSSSTSSARRPSTGTRPPRRVLAAVVLLLATGPSLAQEPGRAEWDFEAAERELELWRHERLVARRAAPDAALGPFTTDGCSGGLSSAWRHAARLAPDLAAVHGEQPPWEHCCVAHDRAYHRGAAVDEEIPDDALASFEARKRADEALRACVVASRAAQAAVLAEKYGLDEGEQTAVYEAIGGIMYRAVRLGGVPCTSLPWRWGYGWPECD